MIKQQIDLLHIFEDKYSREESTKIITYLNDFTMLTIRDATSQLRNDFRNEFKTEFMKLESQISRIEKDVSQSQSKMLVVLVTAIGVATAILSFVLLFR